MNLKGKLNLKFYIVFIALLGAVAFGFYGLYFVNAKPVSFGDGEPLSQNYKMILSVVIGLVVASWLLTAISMLRQIILGCAFVIDEKGIHSTSIFFPFLAFLNLVPVNTIPYSAITKAEKQNNILVIFFDKNKIETNPVSKLFLKPQYTFYYSFTETKTEDIADIFYKYYKAE